MAKLTYGPDDIAELDVMGYLRRNESKFFRSGTYDAVELAGMIATEALILGAENIRIQSDGDWLTVTADRDWLKPYERDAFQAILPFPEAGANSMLAEILAVAFSAGVTTGTSGTSEVVKGEVDFPGRPVDQNTARAVSFMRRRSS
ncbi:hypothetical protein [Streptomyces shenzhenensis]|uniref:hypothetical protein n=1 Tax=Streptomyces shenzhenensis TaxID=943815 RepID=UPI0015EFEBD4|nr:hypothetical protein [Streptomyces shenzhenensis]